MRKIIAIFIITIISVSIGHAQSRINKTIPEFTKESKPLVNVLGYAYNEGRGEWVEYDNVINPDPSYNEKYKSLKGSWMMSKLNQNFKSIQLKFIKVDGTNYYCLYSTKYSGYYKYPNIREDWVVTTTTEYFYIQEDDYKRLKDSNYNNIKGILIVNKHDLDTEKESINRFIKELNNPVKSEYNTNIGVFQIVKSTEGAIRFKMPESMRLVKDDLSTNYFEITEERFKQLLEL